MASQVPFFFFRGTRASPTRAAVSFAARIVGDASIVAIAIYRQIQRCNACLLTGLRHALDTAFHLASNLTCTACLSQHDQLLPPPVTSFCISKHDCLLLPFLLTQTVQKATWAFQISHFEPRSSANQNQNRPFTRPVMPRLPSVAPERRGLFGRLFLPPHHTRQRTTSL